VKRCDSVTECSKESQIQCRNKGKCVIIDPSNPGGYIEIDGKNMKTFLENNPQYDKQILQGSCLTENELNQSKELITKELATTSPPIVESQFQVHRYTSSCYWVNSLG